MEKTYFKQAHKEARWSVWLAVAYLIVWGAGAGIGGNTPGITGFPRWFELSCLLAPLVFIFLCWLMVSRLFQDMPLDLDNDEL